VGEDGLDHLLDGLLSVKPQPVVGNVVFVNEAEEDFVSSRLSISSWA